MKDTHIKFRRWLVPSLTAMLIGLVLFLVEAKPEQAFGRLSYQQLLVVLALVVLWLLSTTIALLPASRRLGMAINLGLAAGSCALVLVLFELALFLVPVKHQMDNPFYLHVQSGLAKDEGLPYARPPHLDWTGMSRGDLAFLYGEEDPLAREVVFKTDMDGFRNHTDLTEAEIAVIGDSFTEAGYLPEEETYSHLLGQKLGRVTRNLGRAGYSAPAELVVLERFGLATKPRTVIWQVSESNDLMEARAFDLWVATGRTETFGKAMLGYAAWSRRSPTLSLHRALSAKPTPLGGRFSGADGAWHPMRFLLLPDAWQRPRDNPGWPVMVEAITAAREICRQNAVEMVVLFIPMKFHVMGPHTELNQRTQREVDAQPAITGDERMAVWMSQLCAELGVPFVDATQALSAQAQAGELVYLPFDTHLSTLGHTIVSELLVAALGTRTKPEGRAPTSP